MSETGLTFTGERLHEDDVLFGIDLLRHRAAYREAIRLATDRAAFRVLEMGSGTGYGARELASALPSIVAVDRISPLASETTHNAHFLCADLEAMPLRAGVFDVIVSFQVIEHLEDPTAFLDALSHHLKADGIALITTPNRPNSDGENPFHVHEYDAEELRALLSTRFESVEMRGVSARGGARRYHEDRLRRIRRIMRIDPLGLRRRVPRALVEWLFARFARLIRRDIAANEGLPDVGLDDFPIEDANLESLDLFAVCHGPRTPSSG